METLAATFASDAGAAVVGGGVAGTAASGPELLLSEGASITSAGPGTGGLFSFLGDISPMTWISGGFGVLSALTSIASGNLQASAIESQQQMEDFRARSELLKGKREAIDAMEALNKTLAGRTVAVAASGITGEGSPGAGREAAIKKAEFETSIIRSNAAINAGARASNADQLSLDADAAQFRGYGGAFATGLTLAERIATRGSIPSKA